MLTNIPFPALPIPPSWYPGHMASFARQLPRLLVKTDVVLELRDSRLPLTSINSHLEEPLINWQRSRGRFLGPMQSEPRKLIGDGVGERVCEHIVIYNKRDLVPEWGFEPFRRAMANKFPRQQAFFASFNKPKDVKSLSDILISLAKRNPYALEMNVLVIGMPNVGKSTLLNALRHIGMPGRVAKAFRTSSNPGATRVISTRTKLSQDPLIYSYDSPGVMLPFLGQGSKGAERGAKLALIAGIKEGLYDVEALATYLLYRLNILNPMTPAYLQLLPPGARPTADLAQFLALVAERHGMIKRGNEVDLHRAAVKFVQWWRGDGGLMSASVPNRLLIAGPDMPVQRRGWGFDFEWSIDGSEIGHESDVIQQKMEECIDSYMVNTAEEEREGGSVSVTQERKKVREEKIAKRREKMKAKVASDWRR